MVTSLGTALNSLTDPAQDVVVQLANDQILDLHSALELLSDETPLLQTVHGITNTGESLGLGKIGGDNLITDVAQAPGDILNGESPTSVVSGIVTDAGHTISDAGGIVSGLGTDLSNPNFVPDLVQGATNIVGDVAGALDNVGNLGNVGDLGNLGNLGGLGDLGGLLNGGTGTGAGGGDGLITIGAGSGDGTPILDVGLLHDAPGNSPIGVAIGSGDNLANVSLLNGGGDHLVSLDGGAAGGNPLLDAGVLTTPDGQSPLNLDVGNGTNLANVDLLPHSDLLSFPDLGGTGTDSLTGVVPSVLGALDLGGITGTGGTGGNPAPTNDAPLLDVHLDGSAPVHIDPHPDALVGLDGHTII